MQRLLFVRLACTHCERVKQNLHENESGMMKNELRYTEDGPLVSAS